MIINEKVMLETWHDLLMALIEAENALTDYINTIEKSGTQLNYGHSVLREVRAAITKATGKQYEN